MGKHTERSGGPALGGSMARRLSITIADWAGAFEDRPCGTIEACCAVAREVGATMPGKVVSAFDLDRCDYDTSGLTFEEWDAVCTAFQEGIREARERKGEAQ